MTPEDAVEALDAINPREPEKYYDPEDAHSDADAILLQVVPEEVAAAYMRLVERADWWAFA